MAFFFREWRECSVGDESTDREGVIICGDDVPSLELITPFVPCTSRCAYLFSVQGMVREWEVAIAMGTRKGRLALGALERFNEGG